MTVGQRAHDRRGWEYEYRPECVGVPVRTRVTFGNGKIGRHEGGGWVLIYGDGYHYDYARSA